VHPELSVSVRRTTWLRVARSAELLPLDSANRVERTKGGATVDIGAEPLLGIGSLQRLTPVHRRQLQHATARQPGRRTSFLAIGKAVEGRTKLASKPSGEKMAAFLKRAVEVAPNYRTEPLKP
jgi:hypothetical protein